MPRREQKGTVRDRLEPKVPEKVPKSVPELFTPYLPAIQIMAAQKREKAVRT
jgi:hypothetical protein